MDPAPATKASRSASELGEMLMDTNLSLFERYKAMFSLRNLGTEEAVLQLARGFEDDSALFRHEIAYVFGQLQHVASVPSLIKVCSGRDDSSLFLKDLSSPFFHSSVSTPLCRLFLIPQKLQWFVMNVLKHWVALVLLNAFPSWRNSKTIKV